MKQLSQKAHAAAFHAEFFGNTSQKRYVLGINEFADAVAGKVKLDGFIDEKTTATEYRGTPVVKPSDVPAGSMVISTETERSPKEAMTSLQRLNGVVSMDYFAVADASHFQLPQVPALADTQKAYASQPEKFEWVRELFADQESREVFDRVMEFRLNANLRAMRFFDCLLPEQQANESFLGVVPGALRIEIKAGDKASASQLDDNITDTIDFIQLNLNSHLIETIEGARWHIQEDQPVLAIAVHHNPAHFWQVPETILDLRSDYKVYLRHYTEGLAETVMFFIPK